MQHRRRRRSAGLLVLAAVILLGCADDTSRPSDASWTTVWTTRQALVPTPDAILEEGEALCGERVGRFRTEMPALLPSPSEVLDAAVRDWIAHAETIVFECSADPAELTEAFETLRLLAAEVDAGVEADRAG